MNLRALILVSALLPSILTLPPSFAAELTLELGNASKVWTTQELLALPQTRQIDIDNDVSYKRRMTYQAIPLAVLLEQVKPTDHIQAVALDGFAGELAAASLLTNKGAQAWLAIEDPTKPWPSLGSNGPSAGPFYLVWQHPEAADIGAEQWPFKVVRLRLLTSVAERFPALLPAANASQTVQHGFALYQANCMACHRLNKAGDSHMGPDLNLPYNPTEYFKPAFLKRYIRDPQSLRRWPQAKMTGFNQDTLSDTELEQLIAYLSHMASRKAQ